MVAWGIEALGLPYPVFKANSYGADSTGHNDSTAAFVKAYAAAEATVSTGQAPGAFVGAGPGVYKVTNGEIFTSDAAHVGFMGAAAGICQLNGQGAGDTLYHYNAAFDTTGPGTPGLPISGVTVDGVNSSGTAAGIHIQDACNVRLSDLQVQNFTAGTPSTAFTTGNGSGIHFTGNVGWSERLLFLGVRVVNCSMHYNFDGTTDPNGGVSFDYLRMVDAYSEIHPGQVGLMVQGFAQLDQAGSPLGYTYNMKSVAAGAASTAIVVGPTDPSTETSRIINAALAIRGEMDGSGSVCNDLHVGTWANFTGHGTYVNVGGITGGAVNSGSVFVAGQIDSPVFTASLRMFGIPGLSPDIFSVYAGKFTNLVGAKGISLIDWAGSAQLASILGGSGSVAGYFSKSVGDILVMQDGAANTTLLQAPAANSNAWRGVVAAAIKSGSATLTAGVSGTIADTNVTASSKIRLWNTLPGGTVGALSYVLTAGTGFVIHSSSGADTSTVQYEIVSY